MAHFIQSTNHLENDLKMVKSKARRQQFTIVILVITLLFSFLINLGFLSLVAFAGIIFTIVKNKGISKQKRILQSGLEGENATAKILSVLPDSYTVLSDLTITFEGKESQLDHVIIGEQGIFIIETKNLNGQIVGSSQDQNFIQHKVGRGGSPYSKSFYNPIKQVSTHVYRLSKLLKENGLHYWVNGMVFFSNPDCTVEIENSSNIPVFSVHSDGVKEMLLYLSNTGDKGVPSTAKEKMIKILTA